MTLFRTFVLATGLVLALCGGAHAQPNGRETPANSSATGKPLLMLQMPALPDPVCVALNPATTALLVLDFVEPICDSQPKCKDEMLPAVTPFFARARRAGMALAYGTREQNMSKWLPEVAPAPGDLKIVKTAQDRFYNTDLDKALKAKGITTIGWKVSGSVAYTSVGATLHDYTVVIPMDTTATSTVYETVIGFYQILNQGNDNLTNQSLKPKAPTLSRTDMITFQ